MKKTLLCFLLLLPTLIYSQLKVSAVISKQIDCITNAEISVDASGGQTPYKYSINKGESQTDSVFKNLPANYYVIAVEDALNKVEYAYITVEELTRLSFTSAVENSTTVANNDGKITVTVIGGIAPYSYTLTNASGSPLNSPQQSNVFSGLKSGVYGIKVQDSGACISMLTNVTILNKPSNLGVAAKISQITCANPYGEITVNAIGGKAPYLYSFNGGSFSTTNVFTDLVPGIYIIMARDTENNEVAVSAEINPLTPLLNVIANTNVLCHGDNTGSITVTTTGGMAPYTYSIDGSTFSSNSVFSNLRAGTYTITSKDSGSCSSTNTIIITEPSESLSATAFPVDMQGIIVNAAGGTPPYSYYLQNNLGVVIAGPKEDGVFLRLPLGNYTAQFTDANGCGYMQGPISVRPAAPLTAIVESSAPNCDKLGVAKIVVEGGISPYEYSFDNGINYSTSSSIRSTVGKEYSVKVRDYQSTVTSLTAIIPEGNFSTLKVEINPVLCKGSASGTITVQATGGKAPYSFALDNSPLTNSETGVTTFINLSPGSYAIKMTDSGGCTLTSYAVITEPSSPLTAELTVKNQTVTINAAGGSGKYSYAISPNLNEFSSTGIFTDLVPGTYTVMVQDENGCFQKIDVTVDPTAPLINGKNSLDLEFTAGQTLADLIVEGQNIKWYSTPGQITNKTSKSSKSAEVTLPLTTVLVDGTTYYASQTINNIESKDRLAVTAKTKGSLSTDDFDFANFKFYPNPVKHYLSINHKETIENIEVFSLSGKSVLSKKINSTAAEIDLSTLSSGMYILNVKSDGKEKAIKFIKE